MKPKPIWMPDHMPALDGLRGVAIALVFLHHCEPRLRPLGLGGVAAWGWCGVDLFFVLSGFLITGIVLEGRSRPRFFRNFYARRGLRIWPLYALIVPLNFWICGRANTWVAGAHSWFGQDWWLNFLLFVQNLSPGLTGTLYPSWSLAIEEQFYLLWAPMARYLPAAGMYGVSGLVLAASPFCRAHVHGLTPVNTLYHLDGLAAGSLAALALRTLALPRRRWRQLALGAAGAGLAGTLWAATGHGALLDTFLALGFAGVVLLAAGTLPERPPAGVYSAWAVRIEVLGQSALRRSGLRFLGRVSYGFYLTHVMIFALLGGVDAYLDRRGAGAGGDLVIVLMRFAVSLLVATLLFYGFERPILRLKRYFTQPGAPAPAAEVSPSAAR